MDSKQPEYLSTYRQEKELPHLAKNRFQQNIESPSLPHTSKTTTSKFPHPLPMKDEMLPQGITFKANAKTFCPVPSSLANYTSFDEGNATPRYFRCTHQCITPKECFSLGFGKQHIGVIVQPLADPGVHETPIPLIERDDIVRCGKCAGYMNVNFELLDDGRNFKCNLCESVDVLREDYLGAAIERKYGMYEYIAPEKIKGRPIDSNNTILLIDCSDYALTSGFSSQAVNSVKATINYIQDKKYFNIGVILYASDISLYYINNENLYSVVLSDANTPFAPLSKSAFLLNLETHQHYVELLFDRLISLLEVMMVSKRGQGSCGGSALKVAIDILKGGSGKILWFIATSINKGLGTVQNRSKPELWNSEKETTLLKPGESGVFYSSLSKLCIESCAGVDIFAGGVDMDLSTISKVAADTGGELYYYPAFDLSISGEKLYYDIFRNLTRTTVYGVSMRARCSRGLAITKYMGSFGENLDRFIEIATLNTDHTITFGIRYEKELSISHAYIQFAIVFTKSSGKRFIRIFNYTLYVTDNIGTCFCIYRNGL